MDLSVIIDSFFNHSTNGLANEALIGVTKSTQYAVNLRLRNGMIIMIMDLLFIFPYAFIISLYSNISGPPISNVRFSVS